MENYQKDYSDYRNKLHDYMRQEIRSLYFPTQEYLLSLLQKFFNDTDYTLIIHENGNKYSLTPIGVPKFKPYYMTSKDKRFSWFQSEYVDLHEIITKENVELNRVTKFILNNTSNNMYALNYVNYVFPLKSHKDLNKYLDKDFLILLNPYKEIVTQRTLANMLLA